MGTVRSASEDDLAELLELYRMLNPADPDLRCDEAVRGQWREMVRDDSVEVVVVEHRGRLVASCLLSVTPNLTRNARPFAVIENVVTHEDERRNGFGGRCLRHAVDIAERRDCYKVMLLTGSEKQWKHEFYEACGFDREAKTGFVLDLRSD